MFISHLPAGYILTKKLQDKLETKKYLWLGLVASVFPDLDMIYFYLIDNKQHLHHDYWIHIPFYWVLLMIASLLGAKIFKQKNLFKVFVIFYANIFLHLFLDTIVGKINWLYPFSETSFSFFEVPAVYDYWVYNFVWHWTFLFEVGLFVYFIILLDRYRIRGKL